MSTWIFRKGMVFVRTCAYLRHCTRTGVHMYSGADSVLIEQFTRLWSNLSNFYLSANHVDLYCAFSVMFGRRVLRSCSARKQEGTLSVGWVECFLEADA